MAPRFHSLLLVEGKLLEGEYFMRRLSRCQGDALGFELNAFLSAARSVTFLIQKEMSKVPGFTDWWDARRNEMRDDKAMRFLLDLRNYSQKAGRVAIFSQGSTSRRWSHWFASGTVIVPDSLDCAHRGGETASQMAFFAPYTPICWRRCIHPAVARISFR
jgi:hypothetical protein